MATGYHYSALSHPEDLDVRHDHQPSSLPGGHLPPYQAERPESITEDGIERIGFTSSDNLFESSQNNTQSSTRCQNPLSQNTVNTDEESALGTLKESPPPKEKHKKPKNFDWAGSWIWEIAGAVFSAVCIVLLVVFLFYVDGKSYTGWQYSVSPNAVISVVVAFAKAAMLIPVSACLGQLKWKQGRYPMPIPLYHFHVLDQASRGPWGALEIFWTVKSFLPMAAAAITILSVAVDPFAQQILAFPSRNVSAHDVTTFVQKAQEYNSPQGSQRLTEVLLFPTGGESFDPQMQIAIFTGLAQTSNPLRPSCPSSRCSYPTFASLGICADCEDITEKATQTCQPFSNSSYSSDAEKTFFGSINEQMPNTSFLLVPANCHYDTPSGNLFQPDIVRLNASDDSLGITRQPLFSTFFDVSEIADGENATSLIVTIFTAKYPNDIIYTRENMTAWEARPIMTQCSINMCEKLYTQNQVSLNDISVQPSRTQLLNVTTFPDLQYIKLNPANGAATFSDNATYIVDSVMFHQMIGYMATLFTSTIVYSGGDDPFPYSSITAPEGTEIAPILYMSDNMTESINNMATSMTDYIRSSGAARVSGEAFLTETFIQVRWPWITLPTISVILSIIVLVSTALYNRDQAVLWKSSVFPLLTGQLKTAENEIAQLRHLDKVQYMSRKIKVVVEDQKTSPLLIIERHPVCA